MSSERSLILDSLNAFSKHDRLNNLELLMRKIGPFSPHDRRTADVNNHIHTWFSFSPYSPSLAVVLACQSGLSTAGLMDHDNVHGAEEFMNAGRIVGISTTIGVECRVDFSKTFLSNLRINNPDQKSIAYIALHALPHNKLDEVNNFFLPYTTKRNERNYQMCENLNKILVPFDLSVSFNNDVIPVSKYLEGGTITERHILYALSSKLISKYGKGENLISFLTEKMRLQINPQINKMLLDPDNYFYAYDLLGLLKSELLPMFYLNATTECPDVKEVLSFSDRIGAISAYAYLGNVYDSVTGDKKPQTFEDDYLELLFETIKNLKFNAVTYMPSRNSYEQLVRVKTFCRRYGLFEISGEDINSPRQKFVCERQRDNLFSNLYDSAWALIGHENEVSRSVQDGMFSPSIVRMHPDLNDRIQIFKDKGLRFSESYV